MGAYDNTLGALLISTLIGFFCTGIVLAQAYTYFARWGSDRLFIKTAVWSSVALTLVNQACWPTWIYSWAVTNFGNPAAMTNIPWAFPAALIFVYGHLLVEGLARFYSWRLKKLGGLSKTPGHFLSLFAACHCTGGYIWYTVVDTTMCPAYTFSLLVSLNSRHQEDFSGSSGGLESRHFTSRGPNKRTDGFAPAGGISVSVQQEVFSEDHDRGWNADSHRNPVVSIRFDGTPSELGEKGNDIELGRVA
ncbi:hypothetical protein RQP46_010674 [Phenoliferia psychrophenolica]